MSKRAGQPDYRSTDPSGDVFLVYAGNETVRLTLVREPAPARAAGLKPLGGLKIPAIEVLERLPVALLVVEANGEIVLASAAARQSLGKGRSLVGHTVADVLAPLANLLDAPRTDKSVSVKGPDGLARRFGYSISELSSAGTSTALHAIVFRDITRVAHVAAERDRLVHLAAVGAAAPAVIHSVTSSLAAISMGLELLAEGLEKHADLSTQASALATEAESVAYRLDAFGVVGRRTRSRRAIDLAPTLTAALHALKSCAAHSGVRLNWRASELRPAYLDPGLVHTFVVALGTNAIQASAPGQRVEICTEFRGTSFVMSVEDTGVGMTPEVLDQCAQLFFTTRSSGRGVGLTLCDQAVRAGGGTLDIESEPGGGTRVTLSMPRATEFEQ